MAHQFPRIPRPGTESKTKRNETEKKRWTTLISHYYHNNINRRIRRGQPSADVHRQSTVEVMLEWPPARERERERVHVGQQQAGSVHKTIGNGNDNGLLQYADGDSRDAVIRSSNHHSRTTRAWSKKRDCRGAQHKFDLKHFH